MKRRSFLKQFSLAASGLATAPLLAHAPKVETAEQFSLNLIAAQEQVDAVLPALEALLQTAFPDCKRAQFAEYPLAGQHVGDLVLIKGREVIDYRNASSAFGEQARMLAKSFGLPRVLENPVLVKFYHAPQNAQPENVNVFVNNVLVKQFALDAQARTHEIAGMKGRMALTLRNGSVKVAGASCRHKTCVKMGAINAGGQQLVCIPNAVRIAIEGRNGSGVDGVTF